MVVVVVVVGRILLFLWLPTLATLKNMRQFFYICFFMFLFTTVYPTYVIIPTFLKPSYMIWFWPQ